MIDMRLSEVDLRRIKSALFDYRKSVAKMLPAEVSIPREVGELIERVDNCLSYINEQAARGNDTLPV